MTRIFTDGAEMGDLLFWDYSNLVTVETSDPGSGVYYYEGDRSSRYMRKDFSPISECYVRARLRWSDIIETYIPSVFPSFLSNGTDIFWIHNTVDASIAADHTGGRVATSSKLRLLNGVWYLVEVHFKLADTNGRVTVRVNGKTYLDYLGDTKYSTYTTFNGVLWHGSSGAVFDPGYIHVDDVAMNDTNGTVDNQWCGDGRVEKISPNAEGDTLQWSPSTGTTHYTLVDEIPNNGDTDYIYSTLPSQQDMLNQGSFTDTNKFVNRLWVNTRAKDYQAVGARMKVGLKTGGTVYMQSTELSLTSGYTAKTGASVVLNPTTGAAWNKTDIDALQAIVESVT
jgi:hypothetical protein